MTRHFTGIATIQYDPHRGQMARRIHWWCVADVDTEITRYCRWWLKTEKHIHLQPPAWDAHISLIRGECPTPNNLKLWKKYHKHKLEFKWDHTDIRSTVDKTNGGMFYWIDVDCPRIDVIRSELGLRTGFKYHLTIGRTYEYDARIPRNVR